VGPLTIESLPQGAAGPTAAATLRTHYAFALSAFVVGFVVNLTFARMGFMPLDASIVFDGGWRILSGQVPWRDFATPYGVTPAAIQAVFFAFAGQTWLAFCLHASMVNGAFAVLLYSLLVVLRLPSPLAFFYALCSTFFFYPMVGVPFIDQHSFFFTLAALAAAITANHALSSRAQWWFWAAVPPLAILAFLSKPVPFAFAAPALPILLLLPAPARRRTRASGLALGMGVSVIALGLLVAVLRVPAATFMEYAIDRPRDMGALRTTGVAQLAGRVVARYDNLPTAMGLSFIENAITLYEVSLVALPLVIGIWAIGRRRDAEIGGDLTRLIAALVLAPWTYVTSMLLGFVTNNQTQNSVAFYPVGAALLHTAICAELRIVTRGLTLSLGDRRVARLHASSTALIRFSSMIALVLLSLAPVRHWTIDTTTWITRVDMTRMVNDMTFDFALAAHSENDLPAGMEFVRWTPSPASFDLHGWSGLVEFLRSHDGNVLILGDTLVTYGLAGKPSLAPNLWFHPGLTMPAVSEPDFAGYDEALTGRLQRFNVKYIVVEGDATRLGFSVGQLPRFSAALASDWTLTRTFGPNRVYEPTTR
jgi:hypothetical protein